MLACARDSVGGIVPGTPPDQLADEFRQVFFGVTAAGSGLIDLIRLIDRFLEEARDVPVLSDYAQEFIGNLGDIFDYLALSNELAEAYAGIAAADGNPGRTAAEVYGFSVELCFAYLKYVGTQAGTNFIAMAVLDAAHTYFTVELKQPAMEELEIRINDLVGYEEDQIVGAIGVVNASVPDENEYSHLMVGGTSPSNLATGAGRDLLLGGTPPTS
jgi:hypothetical protein